MLYSLWNKWLTQRYRWIPSISLVPSLYFLGWLLVKPFDIYILNLTNEDISLIGTLITFLAFTLILPSWVKTRWSSLSPWNALGLKNIINIRELFFLFRGLFFAFLGIALLILIMYFSKWFDGFSKVKIEIILDAIFIGTIVGIAEELIFRGWLLGEVSYLLGEKWANVLQGIIFSLAHIRSSLNTNEPLLIYIGLLLLGILLSFRRSLDQGSLWGAIGLHGGLVGGWFLIDNGLINFSQHSPLWLFGVGQSNLNPIGGVGSIVFMLIVLIYQRKDLERF